jgi:hypothetical protein
MMSFSPMDRQWIAIVADDHHCRHLSSLDFDGYLSVSSSFKGDHYWRRVAPSDASAMKQFFIAYAYGAMAIIPILQDHFQLLPGYSYQLMKAHKANN